MLAHGFTIDQLVELGRAGLITATADCVVTGAHEFEVATLRRRRWWPERSGLDKPEP
jgi:hypothetical protein